MRQKGEDKEAQREQRRDRSKKELNTAKTEDIRLRNENQKRKVTKHRCLEKGEKKEEKGEKERGKRDTENRERRVREYIRQERKEKREEKKERTI